MKQNKEQNQINFTTLKKILKIEETFNITGEEKYNSFYIVKNCTQIIDINQVLYFPISLKEKDDGGGWYIKDYETRIYINEVIKNNPKYTFVVEKEMLNQINKKDIKLIVVENIMDSINKLYRYIMQKRKVKTILVTGSVGKTSTVGLIETVIKNRVLRIYSKRITPIILKAILLTI